MKPDGRLAKVLLLPGLSSSDSLLDFVGVFDRQEKRKKLPIQLKNSFSMADCTAVTLHLGHFGRKIIKLVKRKWMLSRF